MVAPARTPRQDNSPFLATLEAAHAAQLPVRICERIEGGRFVTQHSYPAARIARFSEEPRRGTVVVLENLTRVKVKQITSVTVEQPPAASDKTSAPGLAATGRPYTIACGAGIALRSKGEPFPDEWRVDTDDLITGFGAGEY